MRKSYFLSFFVLVIFINCQKVVDADKLLDVGEKVFITGYLSPTDTILRVRVSKALPAIGTPLSNNDEQANRNLFLVKDASVAISNSDGDIVDLNYSENDEAYHALPVDLPILEGNSYFLNVVVNGVSYSSSCQIPGKVASISENINLRTDASGNQEVTVNASFTDLLGSRNFYVLGGLVQFSDEEQVIFQESLFFDTDRFLNDAVEDGIQLSGENKFFIAGSDESNVVLTLQVAHVEEILYQSLLASDQNNNNGDNPFVEYSIQADNIDGVNGIGIFAGYQITEKTVEIPR